MAAVAEGTQNAGLEVGQRSGTVLQVGGKWMELETFFYRRHIRDAMPRIINWFRDLIDERNPHDRPGHFMTD